MSTIAFAQAPSLSSADNSASSLTAFYTQATTSSVQQSDEDALLNDYPSFPGGQKALENFLNNLDLYPEEALEARREGTVIVHFLVLPNGQLTNARILQSRGELLDKAAMRAMSLMPRWYPAHRAGMTVAHPVKLPIRFRISS